MKLFKEISIVIISGLIVAGVVVLAGSDLFQPSGSPSSSGVTLDDIYHKLNNTSPESKNFSPLNTTDQANFHDLSEIYGLLVPISSSTITSGAIIMGVAGAYDISNLSPENVATGTTYGPNGSLVGTMQ